MPVFNRPDETLIVGGTGFIGRHFCTLLSERAAVATVVSRAPDIGFLTHHAPGIGSISYNTFCSSPELYLSRARTIIYLASASVPATHRDKPWIELEANIRPAFELFSRLAKCNSQARVIFISSGGTVYGAGHTRPINEESLLSPISAYGYGKVTIEDSLRFLSRTWGLRYTILRVSNPVGNWQANPNQGIVNVALRAALAKKAFPLIDEGNQIRDFIDADDVAQAILLAAADQTQRNATWNIGSGVGRSVRSVLKIIECITKLSLDYSVTEHRGVDVDYSVLNCEKAKLELGWVPSSTLEIAIENTFSYLTGYETRSNDNI